MAKGQKELEADVVVIGAGASGLCAALTASLGGATVIVFEKMPKPGGMSNFSEGMFAVESRWQKENKIGLKVAEAFKSHMEATHWLADARLVRTFMNRTAETIDWLEDLGVSFVSVKSIYPDGPRVWHMMKGLAAIGLIKPIFEKVKAQEKVQIFMETQVTGLVKEKDKITGVTVKDKEGNAIHVRAKAVVIACGGFQSNAEWMEKYIRGGRFITQMVPSRQMGEPIQMAWDAGAAPEGLGVLQALILMPGERNLASHLLNAGLHPYLWVNKKGERFCDESIVWRFPIMGNALAGQPDATAYCIFDENTKTLLKEKGVQYSNGEFVKLTTKLDKLDSEIEDGIKEGKVWRGNSLKDLAGQLSIDAKVLQSTVDEYNECCDKNYDFLFEKDRMYLHPIRTPKFYAFKLLIKSLISEGGIKINHKMEVLDTEHDVIPGLYAIGCCAGGMVSGTYNINTTGGSISFAVNSGRMAGENILKQLGK